MKTFDLRTDVAAICDAKGWTVAAELQRRWFAGKSYRVVPVGEAKNTECEMDAVTMAWVSTFKGAAASQLELAFRQDTWSKPAVRGFLRKLAFKELAQSRAYIRLDEATRGAISARTKFPAKRLFDCYVQYVPVAYESPGFKEDKFDDLIASLANYNYRVVVEGRLVIGPPPKRPMSLAADRIGVYIWDSFNFDDPEFWKSVGDKTLSGMYQALFSQPLGAWNPTTKDVKRTVPQHREMIERHSITVDDPGWTVVTNDTYNDWREANAMGADFDIYSDVLWRTLPQPVILDLDTVG